MYCRNVCQSWRKKLFCFFVWLQGIVGLSVHASPVSSNNYASTDNRFNKYVLTTSAILFNVPYVVSVLRAKAPREVIKKNFLYPSGKTETWLNYGLMFTSIACLWPELSFLQNISVNATLFGIQTCMYTAANVHGISLIWSGLTGIMIGRLLNKRDGDRVHLWIPIILNSLVLAYYAATAPPITTIAHGCGVGLGLLISMPLFQGNSSR